MSLIRNRDRRHEYSWFSNGLRTAAIFNCPPWLRKGDDVEFFLDTVTRETTDIGKYAGIMSNPSAALVNTSGSAVYRSGGRGDILVAAGTGPIYRAMEVMFRRGLEGGDPRDVFETFETGAAGVGWFFAHSASRDVISAVMTNDGIRYAMGKNENPNSFLLWDRGNAVVTIDDPESRAELGSKIHRRFVNKMRELYTRHARADSIEMLPALEGQERAIGGIPTTHHRG